MAYDNTSGRLMITLEAAADLSSSQYLFVKTDANGKVNVCTAITDRPIGVLQNKPTSGQAAAVMVVGCTKIVTDAALDEHNIIGPAADSKANKKIPGTDNNEYMSGTMLTATGGAGEIGTAVINCAAPSYLA